MSQVALTIHDPNPNVLRVLVVERHLNYIMILYRASSLIDMSLHEALFWFRANQSLTFLRGSNTYYLFSI
jgi:hypothetical protein